MGFIFLDTLLTILLRRGIICEMKKLLISLFLLIMPCTLDAYVNRSGAVVRMMNKDAGKVQEYTIPVGHGIQVEKLFIAVRSCMQSDPFQAENYFAFVEISENGKGKIFGGWMNRNEPGQNPLQHPDYDVWLVRCDD